MPQTKESSLKFYIYFHCSWRFGRVFLIIEKLNSYNGLLYNKLRVFIEIVR